MKNKVILVILLVVGLSSHVHAAPAIGLIIAGNMSGLSIKATEGDLRPQFIGTVLSNRDRTNLSVGLRGLYSLGNVGKVQRYAGAGVGYEYNYRGYGEQPQSEHNINGQAFVGIEFPLAYEQLVSPFTLSVEVLLQAVSTVNSGVEIGNRIGVGIHYPF